MSIKQPLREAPKLERAHINSILSKLKILPTSDRLIEEIENCLWDLDNKKELSLILQAMLFSYHGIICFDFDEGDLSKAAKFEMCWYNNKQGDDILLQAKEVFSNRNEFLGVFAQQLAHLCMAIVFKNGGLPYYLSDPKRLREQELAEIVENVYSESQDEGKQFDSAILSALSGSDPRKWQEELILRVPHLIAKNGNEKAEEILSNHQSTNQLLNFYRTSIMEEVRKFIAGGESEKLRQSVYRLNRKLGLLKLYQLSEFKFNKESEVNLQEPTSLWVYSSSYPYLTFMRLAWTLNSKEPTNKFYEDNVFCDFDALVKNYSEIQSAFRHSKSCNTLFLVCPDIFCHVDNLLALLEKFIVSNPQKKVILIIVKKLCEKIEKQLARIGHKMYTFE